MLDSEDCTLSLDNLFFERPVVHKVKPLCQEQSSWQLEPPLSLSQIPATQDIQKEAEGLSSFSFSQKSNKFLPPLKRAADGDGFTPKNNKLNQNTSDGRKEPEAQGWCALWAREDFMNKSQDTKKVRGQTKTPHESCTGAETFPSGVQPKPTSTEKFVQTSQWSGVEQQRKLKRRPQPGTTRSAANLRPGFYGDRSSAGKAAGSGPLTDLGTPTARGPPQKTQDKGTKRAHVLPMTPQPLHIQSSTAQTEPNTMSVFIYIYI
ncbi:uncharacterized protein LOC127911062 [Oncorhynchus keta]|uniref:uncharacterized protein LOC127911062 n=1 Tax=Oncorhynchus keta TaxID=8018 RepID=UPI00227C1F62|nr:uncharacterized protein LOC127911062 [Oncorhynchus keta]